MKISARNQIAGQVATIQPGAVNEYIGNGIIITANITQEAIAEGDSVTVIIKASDVLIGK